MKHIKLKAIPENTEDRTAASIKISDGCTNQFLCTVWMDNTITFNRMLDYEVADLQQFLKLSENFQTIFNTLIEKDNLIEQMHEEIRELNKELICSLNPIHDLYNV